MTSDNEYKVHLHWTEQQALDLWGYTHVPAEGVKWQNIYKEDGSTVAVRTHNGYSLHDLAGARWVFCAGRELEFVFDAETVRDKNGFQPSGAQPFPLWLQRERDAMERRRRQWWRFWK